MGMVPPFGMMERRGGWMMHDMPPGGPIPPGARYSLYCTHTTVLYMYVLYTCSVLDIILYSVQVQCTTCCTLYVLHVHVVCIIFVYVLCSYTVLLSAEVCFPFLFIMVYMYMCTYCHTIPNQFFVCFLHFHFLKQVHVHVYTCNYNYQGLGIV